jgi:hypothetical protein
MRIQLLKFLNCKPYKPKPCILQSLKALYGYIKPFLVAIGYSRKAKFKDIPFFSILMPYFFICIHKGRQKNKIIAFSVCPLHHFADNNHSIGNLMSKVTYKKLINYLKKSFG